MGSKCVHDRDGYTCKPCKGLGICEHNRIRSRCKKCKGSQICEHGRRKQRCRECGGIDICSHERQKVLCRECGGFPTLAKLLYKLAKHRAKVKQVPFSITSAEILDLIGDGKCPVFGTLYNMQSRGITDTSANLDRRIPQLGYTKANCVVLSNLANRIKTDATKEEIRRVLEWLEANSESKPLDAD